MRTSASFLLSLDEELFLKSELLFTGAEPKKSETFLTSFVTTRDRDFPPFMGFPTFVGGVALPFLVGVALPFLVGVALPFLVGVALPLLGGVAFTFLFGASSSESERSNS